MSPKKAQNQAAVFTGDTSFYHVKLAWFVSLLSWPITYILNNAFQGIDQTVRQTQKVQVKLSLDSKVLDSRYFYYLQIAFGCFTRKKKCSRSFLVPLLCFVLHVIVVITCRTHNLGKKLFTKIVVIIHHNTR